MKGATDARPASFCHDGSDQARESDIERLRIQQSSATDDGTSVAAVSVWIRIFEERYACYAPATRMSKE
jgi:hypothetical protein